VGITHSTQQKKKGWAALAALFYYV